MPFIFICLVNSMLVGLGLYISSVCLGSMCPDCFNLPEMILFGALVVVIIVGYELIRMTYH